jgi:hypothetical protein
MKKSLWFLFLVSWVILHADFLYAGMSSTNYQIPTSVLSGGGAPMSSDSHDMNGTIGQPTPLEPNAPAQSDFSYLLYPGFWYTLDSVYVAGCWGDFDPRDGDVDGSDLAQFASGFEESYLPTFASEFGRNNCFE